MRNSTSDFVFEIIMENWPEFPGNELYSDKTFAEFCGRQDYIEAFYPHWVSGQDDGAEESPGEFTWEFISKNLYHMYEDGYATEVALRVRHVNSLGD